MNASHALFHFIFKLWTFSLSDPTLSDILFDSYSVNVNGKRFFLSLYIKFLIPYLEENTQITKIRNGSHLKVPKRERELFVTELFTLSDPVNNQPPTAFNFALA